MKSNDDKYIKFNISNILWLIVILIILIISFLLFNINLCDKLAIIFVFILFCFWILIKRDWQIPAEFGIIKIEENTGKDFLEHNKLILEVLLNRLETQHNTITTYENNNLHSRNFYSIILIGLFSLILSSINNNQLLKINHNQVIFLIILSFIVIISMYLLDVHLEDLAERQVFAKNVTHFSIITLTCENVMDSNYYVFDFKRFKDKMDELDSWEERIKRKLSRATHPNFLQILYYLFPLIFIYVLAHFVIQVF